METAGWNQDPVAIEKGIEVGDKGPPKALGAAGEEVAR